MDTLLDLGKTRNRNAPSQARKTIDVRIQRRCPDAELLREVGKLQPFHRPYVIGKPSRKFNDGGFC